MRSEEILKWVVGPNVLDVGCAGHKPAPASPYWLHGRLRQKFPEVVGIDLSSENIGRLRELGFANLHVQSAEDFSFGRKFDTIVAGELIEHLSSPGRFLEACAKHLSRGGRVIVSTPYAFALEYILYALFKFPRTCENGEHAMWFCPSTLTELSRRHGFKVRHWELIEDYELDNPSRLYRLFARIVTTVGRLLIPARLRRNTMLFLLEFP